MAWQKPWVRIPVGPLSKMVKRVSHRKKIKSWVHNTVESGLFKIEFTATKQAEKLKVPLDHVQELEIKLELKAKLEDGSELKFEDDRQVSWETSGFQIPGGKIDLSYFRA